MDSEDNSLRRSIAIAIIENCGHMDPDQPTCIHCIESAKIALTQ